MKALKKTLKLALTIALLAFLSRQFSIKASALVLGVSDWRYLGVAVLLPFTIVPLISVNRWKLFLGQLNIHERFLSLWRINCISIFQGLVLPSANGSDLLRVYYIERRHPEVRGRAGSTVFIERMIGLVVLCLFSLAALPFVATSADFIPIIMVVGGVSAACLAAIVVVLHPGLHSLYAGRRSPHVALNRVLAYVDTFHGAVVTFPYRKILLSSVCLISGFQLALIANLYLVFRAYGHNIPFVQHLALYPIICVISMVPITIGGFGLREGVFVYFYSFIGVPAEAAVCASILNYVILNLSPAALGGLLCLWDSLRGKVPEVRPGVP